ncbi:hypothetical protein OIU84_022574 [Salix udensis]|uniref:Uncharacterized protein n=1 Tax=Salix udensis TaxID=889485 RepID=A0AAD6KNW3_9ROSI|nr:hypothetical protein OIU84_022574 [Salix udensis]
MTVLLFCFCFCFCFCLLLIFHFVASIIFSKSKKPSYPLKESHRIPKYESNLIKN